MVVALFALSAMSVSVSAELAAPVWSTSKQGEVEFYREPDVLYRIDFYEAGREQSVTDTTLTPAKTGGMYSDKIMPYHIEERGEGSYKCMLHIVDDEGNILESSPESEAISYTPPANKIQTEIKVKLKNGKFYFLPTTEQGCAGYELEFYYGYDKDDLWSYSSTYMLNSNVEKRPKDSEGYVEFDLKSVLARYDDRIAEMHKYEPESIGAGEFFAVGISVLSDNPFEIGSSDKFLTTISGEELKLMRASEDKSEDTSVSVPAFGGVDLLKFGKNIKDVIILQIDKKDTSVFGTVQTMDVAPVIVSDYTMLPIRFVAEALGAAVGWDDSTRSVTIESSNIKIVIAVGETTAVVNGETVALDAPSFVSNGRTYLPVRFVSENLGAKVDWDGDTRSVIISQ